MTKTCMTKFSFSRISMSQPSARILTVVLTLACLALSAHAQSDAQKAYAVLNTLPGTWEGNTTEGPVQVTFKSTSAGSALISEIHGHMDMVSMFHLDGPNRLLMTHYCGVGNQPRMQASLSPDGKVITFTFVDATNLASPDAGHMKTMVLTLIDENHHTEEWTFGDHGKEHKAVFDLHRKNA